MVMFLAMHEALSWERFLVPCGTVLAWSLLPGLRCRLPGLWEHLQGWKLAANLHPALDRISFICRKILLC